MTSMTPRRWAIIFFCSLAVNILLVGVIVAGLYFKDSLRGHGRMLYSVPWAVRVIGKEVRPQAREMFEARRDQIRQNRARLHQNYQKLNGILGAEPFDKAAFEAALADMRRNALSRQEMIHNGMTNFAAGLTQEQRQKLAATGQKWTERRERRAKKRQERFDRKHK